MDGPEAPSLIGPGAHFRGLLSFRGSGRVEGTLEGEIHARGSLFIGPRARVHARVHVDELRVAGSLEGEIEVRERTQLFATARVAGSLRTPRLCVAEGALLDVRLASGPRARSEVAGRPAEPSQAAGSA